MSKTKSFEDIRHALAIAEVASREQIPPLFKNVLLRNGEMIATDGYLLAIAPHTGDRIPHPRRAVFYQADHLKAFVTHLKKTNEPPCNPEPGDTDGVIFSSLTGNVGLHPRLDDPANFPKIENVLPKPDKVKASPRLLLSIELLEKLLKSAKQTGDYRIELRIPEAEEDGQILKGVPVKAGKVRYLIMPCKDNR